MQDWNAISPLIAAVYEAAVYPGLWQSALTRICAATGFEAAFLFSSDENSESSVVTPSGVELYASFLAGGWQDKNERMLRMLAKGQHGFVHDLDVFDVDELETVPIYRDFLRPKGFGFGAGTFVQSPHDKNMILSLERRLESGLVGPEVIAVLDMIRPHLARAVMLTIEVQKRQTDLTLQSLSAVGVPAAAIDGTSRILAANELFNGLTSQIFFRSFDRISLRDQAARDIFSKALQTIETDAAATVRSIPVPATDTDPASVVHLVPLRNEARSFASEASAILFVSQATEGGSISHALLRGLYDLTSGEAKLAECILGGLGLREASVKLGISYETSRSVSKRVYNKTGSTGQADLIRRISFLQRV